MAGGSGVSKWWRVSAIVNCVLLVICLCDRNMRTWDIMDNSQAEKATLAHRNSTEHRLGCKLKNDATGETLDTGGEFFKIANKYNGTDKVHPTHHYEAMYAKYLDALRSKDSVRMLEIGLGCNMPAGPGHSTELWRVFFGPSLQYHVLEYTQCIDAWRKTVSKYKLGRNALQWYQDTMSKGTFWGDQADPQRLESMMKTIGTQLDVVLDDGGHSMQQQITSFEHLFPHVTPGGVYIIEDLETSFYPQKTWGGTTEAQAAQTTTVGYMQRILTDLHWRTESGPVGSHHKPTLWSHWVRSIDCDRMVCVITKRTTPFAPKRPKNFVWPCKLNCANGKCGCA
eukprot:TRINITY_DN30618_c0_g1_i1.p1 TRINITY_DN30618_c0_g1~~TRINITY_DN30618_c0_g1_i1.p1  ORF type:complete len:339 (+),score=59.19 TRINITY_DN30618_c0_g1_i1:53-1069(+)